jgi:prepilin-type N-terminal cleavage/methylation domain-containing protein/prepilin-type processing-associated H-X9-DG protein
MNLPRFSRTRRAAHGAPAFTLIELLTVISIIGILAAILIPTVNTVFKKARASQSANNLHSIGVAFSQYSTDNKGYIPAPEGTGSVVKGNLTFNPTGKSWVWELLPFAGVTVPADGSNPNWTKGMVMLDPQYLAMQDSISDPATPVLGYGMNIYPYRPNPKKDPGNRGTGSGDLPHKNDRQLLTNLPDQSNNVLIGCSDAVTLEPTGDGTLSLPTGDPNRFGGTAIYLFVDGSVRTLAPEEAKPYLATKY